MNNEHVIFKPEMMLQDYIKSCWCKNIKTIGDKIPVNQILFKRGIFSLDIIPDSSKKYYSFALPVNKNWQSENFNMSSYLSFEIYSESILTLSITLQNSSKKNSDSFKVTVNNSDLHNWKHIKVPLFMRKDVRLVIFSGSAENTSNYVLRNVVIVSDE